MKSVSNNVDKRQHSLSHPVNTNAAMDLPVNICIMFKCLNVTLNIFQHARLVFHVNKTWGGTKPLNLVKLFHYSTNKKK